MLFKKFQKFLFQSKIMKLEAIKFTILTVNHIEVNVKNTLFNNINVQYLASLMLYKLQSWLESLA